jgi:hypothetical protein
MKTLDDKKKGISTKKKPIRLLIADDHSVAREGLVSLVKRKSEPAKSKNDVQLETSIPPRRASLGSILCTEELRCRPSRPPDYEKENSALVALVSALADSPLPHDAG